MLRFAHQGLSLLKEVIRDPLWAIRSFPAFFRAS
jgi:hypothetical protein